MKPTSQEVYDKIMNSFSVHYLTKNVLKEAWSKDCVDAVHDVELALQVLRRRMDENLGRG
jgi:hypothetical protein